MAGKRGNNEGTIYKRKEGGFIAAVTLPGGGRKRVYGKTRGEAAGKLTQLQAAIAKGLPPTDDRVTMQSFLERWLTEVVKPKVRIGTYVSYERVVRVHLIPRLGKVRLTRLPPEHVQHLLNMKLAEGHAPRHVAYMRAVLRIALGKAVRWGLVHRNVATLADPPHVERKQVNVLDPEQARAFLQATESDRLRALYLVALLMGKRQGELLGLQWRDIDLDAGMVTISRQLQRITGRGLVLTDTKTAGSVGRLALSLMAVDAMRQHRGCLVEERLQAGSEWKGADNPTSPDAFVFVTPIGTPLDGPNVTKMLQRLLKRAGLPRLRFHDLRHSFGSLLLLQGVDLKVVSTMLGHSSITVTADTYAHVLDASKREAVQRLDALLSSTSG